MSVDRRGTPLGRFVYGRRYLERPDSVPLDPVELRLARGVYSIQGNHVHMLVALMASGSGELPYGPIAYRIVTTALMALARVEVS